MSYFWAAFLYNACLEKCSDQLCTEGYCIISWFEPFSRYGRYFNLCFISKCEERCYIYDRNSWRVSYIYDDICFLYIQYICIIVIIHICIQLISYKKVLEVYTRSMETIYLFLMNTGSWGNLFLEIPGIKTYVSNQSVKNVVIFMTESLDGCLTFIIIYAFYTYMYNFYYTYLHNAHFIKTNRSLVHL